MLGGACAILSRSVTFSSCLCLHSPSTFCARRTFPPHSFSSVVVKRYRRLSAKLLARISSLFQLFQFERSNLVSPLASRREFHCLFSQSRLRRRTRERGTRRLSPLSNSPRRRTTLREMWVIIRATLDRQHSSELLLCYRLLTHHICSPRCCSSLYSIANTRTSLGSIRTRILSLRFRFSAVARSNIQYRRINLR